MVETPDELPIPHFEDRLWGELAPRWRDRRGGAGRRRRRAMVAAAAALAAAATVTAVAVVGPGGPGPVSRPERAEASVVERVREATDEAAEAGDSVIHETRREGDGHDYVESWYDEVTSAYRRRTVTAGGDPLVDTGWPEPPAVDAEPDPALAARDVEPGGCDPNSRLAADADGNLHPCTPGRSLPPQPSHAFRQVDHCRREYADISSPVVRRPGWDFIRLFLESGDIVEDGRQEVGGRELIRLRNHDDYVFLVDPETYLPVQVTDRSLGGEPVVTTYERLERTPENLALLSPPVPEGFTEGGVTGYGCSGNPPPGG